MKKLIAIVIAVVMCLSMLPVVALADGDYYVAGVSALCGSEWNASDDWNKMTANGDGTYSMNYTGVAVGTYEFKITNGTWDQNWGNNGNNYVFNVTSGCDVTITFNPADGAITVSGTGVELPDPSSVTFNSITVAGTGSICGTDWDVGNSANNMTANGSVYTITYYGVAAGDHQFKFAANNAWTDNWGLPAGAVVEYGVAMDATYNDQNISLSLSSASDVTLTLDLSGFDYGSKTGAKVTVSVAAASGTAPVETTPAGGDETITVYAYVPEGWENPGIWAWDDSQKNAFDAWPGQAMTEGEDGWWYAEVPSWVQNVIINANNGGVQTADLDMPETADMWIPVTIVDGAVSAEILYSQPELDDVTQPTTEATEAPTTEATEPDTNEPDDSKDSGKGGNTVVTVIICVILIAGAGVAGYFVTKMILAKKAAKKSKEA